MQDGGSVNVEELGVEGEGPEVALGGCGSGGGVVGELGWVGGGGEEGCVGLDLAGVGEC